MDLCGGMCALGFVLFCVATIGHGLWVACAYMLRQLNEAAAPPQKRRCLRCHATSDEFVYRCPKCGLEHDSKTAETLRDLETTAKQLQVLVDRGNVDPNLAEQVYLGLEERQKHLLAPPSATVSQAQAIPFHGLIEKVLVNVNEVGQLSGRLQEQLVVWFKRLERPDFRMLSPPCVKKLIPMVKKAGLTEKLRHLLHDTLDTHPACAEYATLSLEIARLAAQARDWQEVRNYLQPALAGSLSVEDMLEAGRLQQELDAAEQKALDVIPVEEAAPAAVQPVSQRLPPTPSFKEMLGAFMEEKNILWGELVGGMLIVGCSIALVVSLWSTLERIPYFPFLIFAAVTAALYFIGQYTLGHWKLEATSRGLLVIADLLVPLDFLVLAGLSRGRPWSWIDGVLGFAAIAGFGTMVMRAGQTLGAALPRIRMLDAGRLLAVGVVGSAASQLVIARWLETVESLPSSLVAMTLLPVVFHFAVTALMLAAVGRLPTLDNHRVNQLLPFLGQTSFAALVVLGFMVYASARPDRTFNHLALALAFTAMPIMVGGAMVRERLALQEPEPAARGLSAGHAVIVGQVLMVAAALLMLFSQALAWPRPLAMAVLGLVNAAVFLLVAFAYRVPLAHAPGLLCLVIGIVTAIPGLHGAWPTLFEPALGYMRTLARSAETSLILAALVLLLSAFSEFLLRRSRALDAYYFLGTAGIAAFAAIVVILQRDIYEAREALFVFGVCGFTGLAVNLRWRVPLLGLAATGAILGCLFCGFEWLLPHVHPPERWLWASLTHATLTLAVSIIAGTDWKWTKPHLPILEDGFHDPLTSGAIITSLLASLCMLDLVRWETLAGCVSTCLWLAVLWAAIAICKHLPGWFLASQAAITAAVMLGTTAWLADAAWVQRDARGLTHLWSVQTYGCALALLGVSWLAFRGPCTRRIAIPWTYSLDWIITAALPFINLAIIISTICPEIVRELSAIAQPAVGVQLDIALAWRTQAILAAALIVMLWEARPAVTLSAWLAWGWCAAGLIAIGWQDDVAVASAVRWSLMAVGLAASVLIWNGGRLTVIAAPAGIDCAPFGRFMPVFRGVLLAGTAVPVLFLSQWVASIYLIGLHPTGPGETTIFATMGLTASWAAPIGLLALVLLGYAIRCDWAWYTFFSGWLVTYAVTIGYTITCIAAGASLSDADTLFIVQMGLTISAAWALAWLASGRWQVLDALRMQVGLVFYASSLLLIYALVTLLVSLNRKLPAAWIQIGQPLGWIAWLATITALQWSTRRLRISAMAHGYAIAGIGIGILAAWLVAPADPSGWWSYHTLTIVWTLHALLLLAASWLGTRLQALGPIWWPAEKRANAALGLRQQLPETIVRRWVEAICAASILLALGGAWADPGMPYWSCLTTLAVAVLLGGLAVWTCRPAYVYASGLLAPIIGYLAWQSWLIQSEGIRKWLAVDPVWSARLIVIQVLVIAGASAIWSMVEVRLRRWSPPLDLRGRWFPFAHAAVHVAFQLFAIWVLTAMVGACIVKSIYLEGADPWLAGAAVALSLAALQFDTDSPRLGMPGAALFTFGLLVLGIVLVQFGVQSHDFLWWLCILTASYSLAISAVAWRLSKLTNWAQRFDPLETDWWPPCQSVLRIAVVVGGLWIVLIFETLPARMGGPLCLMFLTLNAIIWTVRRADGHDEALLLAWCTSVAFAWAWIDSQWPVPWLHRCVLLTVVSAAIACFYVVGLRSRAQWQSSGHRVAVPIAVVTVAMTICILVSELLAYDRAARTTHLSEPVMILFAVYLACAMLASLAVAHPGLVPMPLSDRTRSGCTWLAEIVLGLTLLHLRLNIFDLVPSILSRNWTLVLMATGYVAILLSEFLRRRRLPSLSRPLFLTGIGLPLVALAAFWLRPLARMNVLTEAVPGLDPVLRYLEQLPNDYSLHSTIWFLNGGLLALVAMLRREPGPAICAGLAANFGLWVIYAQHDEIALSRHPQLWVVPIGFVMLVAEALYRSQMVRSSALSLRYCGLLVIFLSSTADMFIAGLGKSVLMPIILTLFSIAAVMAGISLRIRAFLFSGIFFLFLTIFSQIWHAAVDLEHTWVWWACGIALGAAILATFALFEKKRTEVLGIVEQIRQWG